MKKATLFLLMTVLMMHFNKVQSQPCINVKNHGVKGDGITDDTDSIRAVFNAAGNISCISFPEGIYLIDPSPTRPMNILKSNMTVKGIKGRSILKIKDNSIHSGTTTTAREEVILLSNALNTTIRSKNIHLENLVFDGNSRKNTIAPNKWIDDPILYFANTDGLIIEHCMLLNGTGMGVELVHCQNSTILNNYIFDIGQKYYIITKPNKKDTLGNADAIQLNGCQNSFIRKNVLENVGEGIFCQHWASPDGTLSKVPEADKNTQVYANRISSLMALEMPAIRTQMKNYFNTQHLMTLTTTAGRARGGAIGIYSQHSKVENNTIKRHSSILVGASNNQGDLPTFDIKITNNNITDHNKGHKRVNGAITISADTQTVKDIMIFNNQIRNAYSTAIELQNESLQNCSIDSIVIGSNTIENVYPPSSGESCAYFFINTINMTTESPISSCFKNITISKNTLNGSSNTYRYWLERPTKNLKIENNISNLFNANLFNFADFACILTYQGNTPNLSSDDQDKLNKHTEGNTNATQCVSCN